MSGISRLLRWAPCLWAVSKLAQSSGQAQRTQILTSQSPQQSSGSKDLLQSLSFTASTVVRNSHVPRPSRASTPISDQEARYDRPLAQGRKRVPRFLRYRGARKYDGFRWEQAPLWPILEVAHYVRRASNVLHLLCHAFSRPLLSPRSEQSLLVCFAEIAGASSGDLGKAIRLTNRTSQSETRKAFWEARWLNVRPRMATWKEIGERLRAMTPLAESDPSTNIDPSTQRQGNHYRTSVHDQEIIWKIKLGSGPTDILPITQEEALQRCPELSVLACSRIGQVKISTLDTLNEVLLKQVLRHHWQRISHFAFAVQDCIDYLGRRSIFPDGRFYLPNLQVITVDISNASEALSDELFGNRAGQASILIAELVGRHDREHVQSLELRLFCMPVALRHAQPRICRDHTHLAARIFGHAHALMEDVRNINLVKVFEAPFTLQTGDHQREIRQWARKEQIVLRDAPMRLSE